MGWISIETCAMQRGTLNVGRVKWVEISVHWTWRRYQHQQRNCKISEFISRKMWNIFCRSRSTWFFFLFASPLAWTLDKQKQHSILIMSAKHKPLILWIFIKKSGKKNKTRTVEFALHDNESAHSEFVLDSDIRCNEMRLGKEQTFFVIACYPTLMLSFLFTPAFTAHRIEHKGETLNYLFANIEALSSIYFSPSFEIDIFIAPRKKNLAERAGNRWKKYKMTNHLFKTWKYARGKKSWFALTSAVRSGEAWIDKLRWIINKRIHRPSASQIIYRAQN